MCLYALLLHAKNQHNICKGLETSILKVLHGNTKSPTGCMYSYTILRTLVIDVHAKNQDNICKGIEKSLENCSICEIY